MRAKRVLAVVVGLTAFICSGLALASGPATSGIALSVIGSNINQSVSVLATILSDIALIAGVGFVMASFFKFHQHKLNPTQVSLSQGITLILIGAGLILFPSLLPTTTRAVFGTSASVNQIGSGQIGKIIGGSSTAN